MSLIRHDVMIVDPLQNVIIERESGEPLFIDFGRGETAGSIYTTRIKTYMKKVLTLLVRSVAKSSFDIAARFIRDIESCLFEELELWQDEKTRDQKKAVALIGQSTKWQEGIECCREIWNSDEENAFRKMFKDQPGICPAPRRLRDPRELDVLPDSEDENDAAKNDEELDDPEGYCNADVDTLTPVQRLLRQKRQKGRRAKLPPEKPNIKITITELLPDGTLGLGLDDAPEDMRGVIVVQVNRKIEKLGIEVMDRIIEVNGKVIDDWDDFRDAWSLAKMCSENGVVFGIVRFGVELPAEPVVPRCLHCGVKGKHLQKCSSWKPMPDGEDCVYFCTRECQREAWKNAKKQVVVAS
mmetsp:Transcript_124542/g.195156  ORF Transcript_124542/g.195156 Transcript_124542/m.195156 type:complete len:354 (+) Transcript_124542:3-1064(+)